jgi:hypothetical protein
MNTQEINTHLEVVKDRQIAFKSPTIQRLACRIVRAAVTGGYVWPDQVSHDDIPAQDRNCIGSTYRLLCNVGIIQRQPHFRRSEADDSKGRTIFQYALLDRQLGRAFLRRNDPEHVAATQMALI